MLKKKWIYLLIMTGWLVWISGIFGNNGVLQAYRMARVRNEMSMRIEALSNEKQQLQTTLYGLKHDPYVQEQNIRETLGYVRPNELVFEFK